MNPAAAVVVHGGSPVSSGGKKHASTLPPKSPMSVRFGLALKRFAARSCSSGGNASRVQQATWKSFAICVAGLNRVNLQQSGPCGHGVRIRTVFGDAYDFATLGLTGGGDRRCSACGGLLDRPHSTQIKKRTPIGRSAFTESPPAESRRRHNLDHAASRSISRSESRRQRLDMD